MIDFTYKLEDIKMEYNNKLVLDIKSFEIKKGGICCIMGPSGAGKSTLLRLLNFLDRPKEGRIYFDGKDFNGKTPGINIMRQITTVFQRPALLNTTVYNNIVFPLKLRGIKIDEKTVDYFLDGLQIAKLKAQSAKSLSGGEAQRVALARALIFRPKVLLLDEATANLDSANIKIIEDMIKNYVKSGETTVVMVTHNIFQAKRMADCAAFLYEGRIIEWGDGEKIFNNPKNKLTGDFIDGKIIF